MVPFDIESDLLSVHDALHGVRCLLAAEGEPHSEISRFDMAAILGLIAHRLAGVVIGHRNGRPCPLLDYAAAKLPD